MWAQHSLCPGNRLTCFSGVGGTLGESVSFGGVGVAGFALEAQPHPFAERLLQIARTVHAHVQPGHTFHGALLRLDALANL